MGYKLTINTSRIDFIDSLAKEVAKAVNEGLDDVAFDLQRVSSGLTPIDKGNLTKAYKMEKKIGDTNEYTLSFSVFNKGFNYAEWTHNATYNLGPLSQQRIPPKSKYSTKKLKVGPGYLEGTAEKLSRGYTSHIEKKIVKVLTKYSKKG